MADLKLNLGRGKKGGGAADESSKAGKSSKASADVPADIEAVLPPATKVLSREECEGDGGVVTHMVVMQRDYGQSQKKPMTMSDIKL